MNEQEIFRIGIKFDRLNSKYNRLWEQLTNLFIFVFASFVAYSVLYLGNFTYTPFSIFLTKCLIHLVILVFPIVILFSIISTTLYFTKKEINIILRKYKIFE